MKWYEVNNPSHTIPLFDEPTILVHLEDSPPNSLRSFGWKGGQSKMFCLIVFLDTSRVWQENSLQIEDDKFYGTSDPLPHTTIRWKFVVCNNNISESQLHLGIKEVRGPYWGELWKPKWPKKATHFFKEPSNSYLLWFFSFLFLSQDNSDPI